MTDTVAVTALPDGDRPALATLSAAVTLPVLLPDDAGYDAEVAAFNLATRHRPAVVVRATCADDVVAAVRHGIATATPVAVQATGHGAAMAADGVVLVTTSRMQDVHVDPIAESARVGAGVKWVRVIEAAAPYHLAPLSGSSSDVGAVGYTLGGGVGPLGRLHGFAADHVRSIDVVTGDGEQRTVTHRSDPDLFWALRGGKGNFGIVTSMEVGLVPVTQLYAGGIFYAGEHAAAVLHTWRRWVDTLPEETSTSVALLRLPDHDDVPPPLRGVLSVHLRVAHAGDQAEGERLVATMRAAAPSLADLVRPMPFTECDSIHLDPTDPLPFWESARLLRELPTGGIDRLVEVAGRGRELPLAMVELRHLGGALGRPARVPNAVAGRDAAFSVFVLGPAVPGLEEAVPAAGRAVLDVFAPYLAGSRLVNFLGEDTDPDTVARAWSPEDSARLRELKAAYDPAGIFTVGHCLPTDLA
jgi:FAD/FMN-containing dehydrogenase